MRLAASALVFLVASTSSRADDELATCFGTDRASPGSLFGTLALGQTTEVTFPPTYQLGEGTDLSVERTGKRVDAITLELSDTTRDPPICPALRARLVKAWGPPTTTIEDPTERWWARSGARAAELVMTTPPGCRLRFYRIVPPAQWLSRSRTSVVPLWAIGEPASALQAVLAPLEPVGEEDDPVSPNHAIRWNDTSIRGEHITLEAFVAKGRVVGVAVQLDGDTGHEAWRRLTALFGAPDAFSGHEEMWRWTWRGRLPIELANDNGYGDVYRPGRTPDMHPKQPSDGGHMWILFGRRP